MNSQCYFVHRHLNNVWHNNGHIVMGTPCFTIIANNVEDLFRYDNIFSQSQCRLNVRELYRFNTWLRQWNLLNFTRNVNILHFHRNLWIVHDCSNSTLLIFSHYLDKREVSHFDIRQWDWFISALSILSTWQPLDDCLPDNRTKSLINATFHWKLLTVTRNQGSCCSRHINSVLPGNCGNNVSVQSIDRL